MACSCVAGRRESLICGSAEVGLESTIAGYSEVGPRESLVREREGALLARVHDIEPDGIMPR